MFEPQLSHFWAFDQIKRQQTLINLQNNLVKVSQAVYVYQ